LARTRLKHEVDIRQALGFPRTNELVWGAKKISISMAASCHFLPIANLARRRLLLGGREAAAQDPHMSCIQQEQSGSLPCAPLRNYRWPL